ncbi:long-chain-fatty acid transport protein [Oryzomicrobium terrae]|uniref:Long-chain-fatty acid transport protein n=1 Tax=Oryzomicrobium terrae TaxID=1735038 RepID=A0A5C1EBZ9_9RHOO|nr:outer membrane protein transport protein [Oryzomicrobium terrae]QEL66129.1 long-chain-fatty acid transport protein [Oryzomicrobium terrae]
MKKGTALRVIPAAILALTSGYASASGFQLLEQNASGLGNAYAGSAANAENASVQFYNPAAMSVLGEGASVSVGFNAITPSYKFSNEGSKGLGGQSAQGSNGGDAGDTGYVPNAYLAYGITKDISVGLGLGAPFGLKSEYNPDWVGSAQSIKFDVKTININPSISWKVNDTVSLGAGVSYQKLDVEYVRRIVPQNNIPFGTPPTSYLGTQFVTLKADDWAWGWNVGALFTLAPSTKVGVSYRSQVKHEVEGNLSSGFSAANGNAKVSVNLPDTFILSVTQALSDRWEMLGDVSLTRWSTIKKLDVLSNSQAARANGGVAQILHTEFQDAWRVALGANYKVNDAWKLKLGIAYDQTPVKNASTRLASLPDNDRTWFSIGAQWKPAKDQAVDVGFAYLLVPDAKINNNQTAATENRGNVVGTYKDSAYILGAQYSIKF